MDYLFFGYVAWNLLALWGLVVLFFLLVEFRRERRDRYGR